MTDQNPVPAATPKRTRKSRGESGHSQTINLRSGGSIKLSGDFNLFSMSPEDVTFVSELGAAMRKYNDASGLSANAKVAAATAAQATSRPVQSAGPSAVTKPS